MQPPAKHYLKQTGRGGAREESSGIQGGGERLAAVCMWHPWRYEPIRIKETESTMDELPVDSKMWASSYCRYSNREGEEGKETIG